MPTSGKTNALLRGPVRVALVHPMRTWVDSLDVLLRTREDVQLVVAHTSIAWVHHAVAVDDVHVLLLHLDALEGNLDQTLKDLFVACDDLAIVVLSDSHDPALICSAVRSGVRGWVNQSTTAEDLVRVLIGVARGDGWMPPALLAAVLDELVEVGRTRESTSDAFASLTLRELEVLRGLALGLSRLEIAQQYTLSPHTVRTHINHVLHKLDVHSTLAAVSLARRVGLDEARSHHQQR